MARKRKPKCLSLSLAYAYAWHIQNPSTYAVKGPAASKAAFALAKDYATHQAMSGWFRGPLPGKGVHPAFKGPKGWRKAQIDHYAHLLTWLQQVVSFG